MRFSHFSELMKQAACMIGNSSAGVREAPFLGVPSLDIGTRQTNRAQAVSVFAARAEDSDAIGNFLNQQWGRRYPSHSGFGEGQAAQRFAAVLNQPEFWAHGLQKNFHDHE
jgi:UDP-N-acetylglucosamine 2-epimerase (hydrolysing)